MLLVNGRSMPRSSPASPSSVRNVMAKALSSSIRSRRCGTLGDQEKVGTPQILEGIPDRCLPAWVLKSVGQKPPQPAELHDLAQQHRPAGGVQPLVAALDLN